MERARLSPLQGMFLVVNTVLPTAVLFLPGITSAQARTDAWISGLVTLAAGMAIAWVYVTLAARFPGRSLIRLLPLVLGRWGGAAAGLIYLWWWLHIDAIIVREFAEFMVTAVLPDTPISVFVLLILAAAAYAVRGGIEVVARTNEVVMAVMILSFLAVITLGARDIRFDFLRPVLARGWAPVLRGAWAPTSWYGEVVTSTMMILPFLPRSARPLRVVWGGLILLTAILVPVTVMNETVLGFHLTATSKLPTLATIQMISVADFIERVEPVFVAIWVLGNLIKIAIFYYACAAGTAQWLGLPEYRSLVLPVGVLMATLSLTIHENASELSAFLAKTWPPYALTVEFLLPLFLLLVAALTGARSGRARRAPALPDR